MSLCLMLLDRELFAAELKIMFLPLRDTCGGMPPQVSRSGRNMILSSAANSSLSRSMRHKDIQSSFYYFHLTSMLTDKQRKKRLISDGYSELPDVFQRLGKGEH